MKTLRLNRAESTAYTNGERRFWRAMKPQPSRHGFTRPNMPYWNVGGYRTREGATNPLPCPYGKPGDRIGLQINRHGDIDMATITAITVEQRSGRWGWVLEVGA